MPLKGFIKEVGRGAVGARSLSVAQAEQAFGALLDGGVPPLQVGAFLLALRVKGEALDEIEGFVRATEARCRRISGSRPVIVLPSYNGARRLPNLTPLLAMALAQDGMTVLVHGLAYGAGRVTSAAVFTDLGLPPCPDLETVHARWSRRQPAFVEIGSLCPGLRTLLDARWEIGLRNAAHTVAKLLAPVDGAPVLRVVNTTHPEFARLVADWVRRCGVDAVLLRGTEGEPVADPRRQPAMDVWRGGRLHAEASLPAQQGTLSALPLLPREIDASTTALYIQSVLGGEKPMPAPIATQAALLRRALEDLAPAPAHERSA
jgi:anthranilate phosphoribosyltransferase